MKWILIIICIAAIVSGIHLFQIKRQLRRIAAQLDDCTDEKTEKKITVSLIDADLNELAAAINRNLDVQKKLRIDMRRSDLQLKNSIANLSHDLRTPLTSILGYLQLSRNSECPAEKRDEYLGTVNIKANTLKLMIDSLYELSVLDIREAPIKTERLDLNFLLGDVLAGQYEQFKRLGITLAADIPDHPVWINGDRVACMRVIQNLLNNSSRYTDGNVGVSLKESGSYAVLSIRNPAPYLKADDIEHLFERFYTTDKSRNTGGSGLGLYIVKTLLERMDGKVIGASLDKQILDIKVGFQTRDADNSSAF